MAELSGGAFVAEKQMPVEDQPSTNPGAERHAEHRRRSATRTHAVFGQREGPRVVDQVARRPDRIRHFAGHPDPIPNTWNVGNEPGHPRAGIEDARHANPDRLDALCVGEHVSCHIEKLPHHAPLAGPRFGGEDARL